MFRIPKIVCLAACLVCVAFTAQADDAIKFRYKMDKSYPLIYETKTEVNQTQSVNGMEFKNEIKGSGVSVHTLLEEGKDGNLKVQNEVKRITAYMKIGPLGEYKFDSKSTDNEKGSALGGALTPLYETLNGSITTYVRSPLGKVLKIEGLTELLADVIKDNPIATQFAGGATDKGAVADANQLSIHFPEKAIKPGDTWVEPFEMEVPKIGTIKGKTTYKYEGAGKVGDRKTAKFTSSTEMSIDLDIKMGEADVKGTLSSTESTGTIHFDPVKGQLVLLTGTMKFEGSLTVEAGGMTINVDQNQTQKMTITLLDKLPE